MAGAGNGLPRRQRDHPAGYCRRNAVERGAHRRTQWCGLAVRFDRHAATFRAVVNTAVLVSLPKRFLGQTLAAILPPMLTTRPASATDEPRVLQLLSQLFGRDVSMEPARSRAFRRMLETPERGIVLVVEETGGVLGVITVSYNLAVRFDSCYAQIEELVVDAAARGKQAGAILVRAAIEEARRHGCNEIGLYPREETRAFYEKLGFTYAGVELRQRL